MNYGRGFPQKATPLTFSLLDGGLGLPLCLVLLLLAHVHEHGVLVT